MYYYSLSADAENPVRKKENIDISISPWNMINFCQVIAKIIKKWKSFFISLIFCNKFLKLYRVILKNCVFAWLTACLNERKTLIFLLSENLHPITIVHF